MQNELIIRNYESNNETNSSQKIISTLKMIANDSLFYFALILFSLFILQYLPFFVGIFDKYEIGINEVVASIIGFANVFFLQVFHKIFRRVKNQSVS